MVDECNVILNLLKDVKAVDTKRFRETTEKLEKQLVNMKNIIERYLRGSYDHEALMRAHQEMRKLEMEIIN